MLKPRHAPARLYERVREPALTQRAMNGKIDGQRVYTSAKTQLAGG